MNFTIALTTNAKAVLRRLESLPDKVRVSLKNAMDRQNAETMRHIIRWRLTGRGPFIPIEHRLGVRTGKLRQAMRWEPATIVGDKIVGSIGCHIRYAAAHEFGFEGKENVRAHERNLGLQYQVGNRVLGRRSAELKDKLTKSGKVRKAHSASVVALHKSRSVGASVRSYTRNMLIPERAPIRFGISEKLESYAKAFSRAIVEAWAKAGITRTDTKAT